MSEPKVVMGKEYIRLTIDKLNPDGCLNLLEYMLTSIGQEYAYVANDLKKRPNDPDCLHMYNKVKDFIESDYFSRLTGMNGRQVFRSLEEKHHMIGVVA